MLNIINEISKSDTRRAWALTSAFIAGGWDNISRSAEIREALITKFGLEGESIFEDAVNFSEITKAGYYFAFSKNGFEFRNIDGEIVDRG